MSHKCSYTHPLHVCVSNTSTLNKLATVMALSQQLLTQTGIKGHCAGREDCFLNPFMHRRTAMTHPEPSKAFLKLSPETAMLSAPLRANQGISKVEPRDSHVVCTLWVLPLSHPFCWSRTYLQRSLQEVTSQDEIFMPDMSNYIWEKG